MTQEQITEKRKIYAHGLHYPQYSYDIGHIATAYEDGANMVLLNNEYKNGIYNSGVDEGITRGRKEMAKEIGDIIRNSCKEDSDGHLKTDGEVIDEISYWLKDKEI